MPVPTTQKALIIPKKYGQWTVSEFEVPTPGPKDVLVKIIATALNPVDWKVQGVYNYLIQSFPHVGGSDAAGIVEDVGSEVTSVKKGDRVVYQGYFENPKATFQQYGIVPAEITARIPDNISFDQAASIPLGLATVVIGLYNHDPNAGSINIPAPWEEGGSTAFAGKPVFIIGGSSSVGQYAIQAARLSGFSPIITTASLHNEPLLKPLGATYVIDRKLSPDAIKAEVARLAGGKPVELVYDAISLADTQLLGYDVLAPGGNLVLVLPDLIPPEKKRAEDNKKVVKVTGNVHLPENRAVGVQLYSRLTEWLEKGLVVPNRVEVLPNGLAGIPEGLERLKQDKVSGTKLIVHPHETP